VRRLRFLIPACALALAASASASAPALGSTSGAALWTALGGNVTCGIAIHPPNTPPSQVLCSAQQVPAPRAMSVGDPGFVFLRSAGRPTLARLSQDTFVGIEPVALRSGRRWHTGPISVTCTIGARSVRCENRSHHGFTITKSSYRAF
jgi:hypothetical protein